MKVVKRARGGIRIHATCKHALANETIAAVLKEFRLINADVVVREDISIDQLIDVVEGNRAYLPSLVVLGKADTVSAARRQALVKSLNAEVVVSAHTGEGIDGLKEAMYEKLAFMSIYLKEINKKPDMDVPLVMRKGTTIGGVCDGIHRDLAKKFRYARLWGPTAKFPGQIVRDKRKELRDGDIVEIHD